MRIAFTSSDGHVIDEHFGTSSGFSVWEVGPETAACVGRASCTTTAGDEEDRIAARANAIAGCAIVYTAGIGGPAAAKLVARRIHPMRADEGTPIAGVVSRLQEVLRGNPPPWLRKAMGGGGAGPSANEG